MRRLGQIHLLLFAWCLLVTPVVAFADESSDLNLQKLNAFARTYGYVRFFHPSDEASLVDWNQLAVFGAARVLDSPDDEPVEQVLTDLFSPLVVDLEVYKGAGKPKPKSKKVPAAEIVAWQHSGVGLAQPGIYRSVRINRSVVERVKSAPFANVLQAVDANDLRGMEIRFRFRAKEKANSKMCTKICCKCV